MSNLLTEYEGRLREREILSSAQSELHKRIDPAKLKFAPSGAIKPFYGLTCIAWVDPKTRLYQKLCMVQNTIQAEFERAGVGHIFSFLEPASFHMTICDITASSTPRSTQEAKTISAQIHNGFSRKKKMKAVSAQVRGIGLTSTITALVRFKQESELQKVLHLERQIKQATQVDVRNFSGHISLAYCATPPRDQLKVIWEILQPYHDIDFGALVISEFDLTCFIDMNTYISLLTVNIETGQVDNHANLTECQFR